MLNTTSRGDLKQVTFPWDNGQTVDDIEKYYDDIGFSDWTHSLSKAPMLKSATPLTLKFGL